MPVGAPGLRRLHVNDLMYRRRLFIRASTVQRNKQIERARITGVWPFLAAEDA
jgi:hypothetical protein